MTGEINYPYNPKNAGEVVSWCRKNGIIPIPCQPKSKAPLGIISKKGIYKKNPPSKEELLRIYDRRFFGKNVSDSFHVPSPKRILAINNFWDSHSLENMDERTISISLDMNYPTNDGYTIACIDIDSDSHKGLSEINPFIKCPLVGGKKGGKIFFRLDKENKNPSPIIQYSTKENLNLAGPKQKPALIELFTGHKHALIYGEHPDSTLDNPIFYYFKRGFDSDVPLITWNETTKAIANYADEMNLVVRKTSSVIPYDQTNLTDWV